MKWRLRWAQAGAHVQVRVFVGPDDEHLALTGTLTMREPEFAELRETLPGWAYDLDIVEDRPTDPRTTPRPTEQTGH